MIKIRNGKLPQSARASLAQYQDAVDQAGDYAAQVAAAQSTFRSRNRSDNLTFAAIRAKLTEMCSGHRRCMYCEDAPADEIEHHRPKGIYPEWTFVWRNYLYACGPCNGPKNNRFAVIQPKTHRIVDICRPRGGPILPPTPGIPALIDPRHENPLDYLMLDLRETFELTPFPDLGPVAYRRAVYTIDVLRLNARDYLVKAREDAFRGCRARLCEYIQQRDAGASPRELMRLKRGFRSAPHATVWYEMKRQHRQLPELAGLFRSAPEAESF